MSHVNICLDDPLVAEMLGRPGPLASNKPRPLVQLAGDVPDPTGYSSHRGFQSTTRLSAGKQEVLVVYGDLLLTVDVYVVPGEPLVVHLYCPRCRKHATVRGDQKAIDFEPTAENPMRAHIAAIGASGASGDVPPEVARLALGRLSIEAFECPWEMGEDAHVQGGVHTGAALCRQRLVIDANRARDA